MIGVESVKKATEFPRAYVVHARPNELKNEVQKAAFALDVKKWIQGKVARHKFLRGGASSSKRVALIELMENHVGVVVIDIVPKR